jgi:platelet-activating factor acetylhydrolase IB subunit alpha
MSTNPTCQIIDLETRLSQATEEISKFSSGSAKKTNAVWYPSSAAKHTFHGHREAINAVAFHPVFSSLASASGDATIKIWDWDSGELERTLKGHTKPVTDCDYDSTGRHLGSCHPSNIFLIPLIDFSLAVSSSYDLFVKLWNVEDGYKNIATLRGHEHSISSVRFLPGDNRVASSSRDNTVRVWDVTSTYASLCCCLRATEQKEGSLT